MIYIIVVSVTCLHHGLEVMIVGNAQRNGVRVCLAEICLSVVSQIVAVLIPVERISGRCVFDTVDVALGVRLLLEYLPATTCYLVSTRCYVWLAYSDVGTRQHSLWSLDVLDGRNTALEEYVDVHYVTLTDWGNICTCSIALLVVILIDYGDNLLLREVEDIREAADVQRTCLRRCYTVDGEVFLVVLQITEVFITNYDTHWNRCINSVGSCYATTDCDTCYSYAFGVLTNLITLAAVVVCLVLLLLGKGQGCDIRLVGFSQTIIRTYRDYCTHSIWCVTYLEWSLHNIYFVCICHFDSSVVTLFVRQFLVVST